MTALIAVLALATTAGCSDSGDDEPEAQASPTASEDPASETPTPTPSPSPSPSKRADPEPQPHPVSLQALMEKEYDGRDLRLVRLVTETDAYSTYYATFKSGRLTISGLANVPKSKGPHPAVVLAHGYIDPAVYVNGQGLVREQDYLARAGYLTLHVDYRNHASSSNDPTNDVRMRLGYTEDVINAVLALRGRPQLVDGDRIGLLGRSMGGGVVYNVLTVQPGLVDAAVAFAPVSSDTGDNFNRWIRPDPTRAGVAQQIIRRFGAPEERPRFWANVSPRTFFDQVDDPLLIHHGTSDDTCPIQWTYASVRALERAGAPVRLWTYEGEEHAFIPQWPLSMRRTVAFLDRNVTA